MRITQQLLRTKANGPMETVEYIDLSNLGIVSIERLNSCPKLQTLNLRGNFIVEISNIDQNRNLWNLDLSNNVIKDVDCLTKFVALGTLNLANNDLSWHEVGKLRHLHILELSLHGNKQLEKDPYYRVHLIDCLPHVWMLDGRIITSADRLKVKHFFADSALTDHPVRHKLSKEWFVPSSLKKIEINGIYGDKATHLMIRFPSNGPCNVETDHRRLKYMAHSVQNDLLIEKKYTKRDIPVLKYRKTFIEDILDVRSQDRERCNMLLLLLVASLEFVMPTHLVKETLEVAKLTKIGKVYAMDFFILPKDIRCRIVCILLGAVKIDKDTKEDGSLDDKLYLCLFYTVAELSKLSNSIIGKSPSTQLHVSQLYRHYKCLLASEIVQLLCIVPVFFEYIYNDVGVMNLLAAATGDTMIIDKINKLTETMQYSGGDMNKLYEELSEFLLQKVQEMSLNLSNKAQKLTPEEAVISITKSIPMKSPRSPLDAAEFHMKGITSPNFDPPTVLSARQQTEKNKIDFPHLGDCLLLGPQTMGKIIGLPQPFEALVAMDSVPVANGAMESKLPQSKDHYVYVNMNQFDWNQELVLWKPKGSTGDKFTIHSLEDMHTELCHHSNMVGYRVPRPNSPEDLQPCSNTSGLGTSTPLIYSTTVQPIAEFVTLKSSNQQEGSPRPITSLLKEKLDLKLDFGSCRMSSTGIGDRPTCSLQSSPVNYRDHTIDIKSSYHDTNGQTSQTAESQGCHGGSLKDFATNAEKQNQQNTAMTESGYIEHSKEYEPEHEILLTDRPASAPSNLTIAMISKPGSIKSGACLKVNIPQVNIKESEQDLQSHKESAPIIKCRQTFSNRFILKPGKLNIHGKTRPFSAVDAYRYILNHPHKGSSDHFNTSYQQQCTEAWKQSASAMTLQPCTYRQATPPPQRPTSPDPKVHPHSAFPIKKANDWLAGGRDLYWESLQMRPRSGHVPGWKEGLPDSMSRPRIQASTSTCQRNPRSQYLDISIAQASTHMYSIYEDPERNT